jgi:hypothetical protein
MPLVYCFSVIQKSEKVNFLNFSKQIEKKRNHFYFVSLSALDLKVKETSIAPPEKKRRDGSNSLARLTPHNGH